MRPRELIARLRDRFRRDALQAVLDEELRHHQAMLERDDPMRSRSLGNVTYYREEARAMWSLGVVDDLLHDLRYAARVLRRNVSPAPHGRSWASPAMPSTRASKVP